MRILFVAGWLAMALVVRAELRVVGSDLLGVEFSRTLYALGGREGLALTLALDGSLPAAGQVAGGRADLALVISAGQETPAIEGVTSLTLAYHAVVVVASADLPLEKLTLADLAQVFGERPAGRRLDWSGPGVGGDRVSGAIAVAVPEPAAGLTLGCFCQTVLGGRGIRGTAIRYAEPAEAVGLMARDRMTLALAARIPAGALKLKAVPVGIAVGEPAFTPTPENLHAGDYPLRLPLRLLFRQTSADAVRPLLRILFTDEVSRVLERAGFVPLASAARRHQLAGAESR